MEWQTPKTNWTNSDAFNVGDFNRIKNNTMLVSQAISSIHDVFEIDDMGDDLTYSDYYDADFFNAIENNIEEICKYSDIYPVGLKQTFYPNASFIKSSELNRIEGVLSEFEPKIYGWILGRKKLPMNLGRNRNLGF